MGSKYTVLDNSGSKTALLIRGVLQTYLSEFFFSFINVVSDKYHLQMRQLEEQKLAGLLETFYSVTRQQNSNWEFR